MQCLPTGVEEEEISLEHEIAGVQNRSGLIPGIEVSCFGVLRLINSMGEQEPNYKRTGREPNQVDDDLKPLFALGQIVGTPGALQALEEAEQNPLEFILRHVTGDWGEMPEEDVRENERSVTGGLRIFSSYALESGAKIWVITEWDRSVTTLLKPEEY